MLCHGHKYKLAALLMVILDAQIQRLLVAHTLLYTHAAVQMHLTTPHLTLTELVSHELQAVHQAALAARPAKLSRCCHIHPTHAPALTGKHHVVTLGCSSKQQCGDTEKDSKVVSCFCGRCALGAEHYSCKAVRQEKEY